MRVLAHELRNLIGTMRNAAHLIRLRSPSDATILAAVQSIDRQIDAMLKLLERVVDAERIARGDVALEAKPVDVHAAILGVLEKNRKAIEDRGQHVHLTSSGNAVFARSDGKRLMQVLDRLVGNASRFTAAGGAIWIGAEEQQGRIRVHVRDDGAGMGVDFLSRVFALFAASDQSTAAATAPRPAGLGIGLPTMRALTRLLGGDLEAHSAGPGRGSQFIVSLPAWAGTDDAPQAARDSPRERLGGIAPATTVPAAHQPRRILLVDDSAAVRDSLSDLLQDAEYEVRAAGDGEDALRAAQAWRPDFVLLDINIPLIDGYEVARRLRARFPRDEMKLVMISGVTLDEATTRDAQRAGFDFCFDKAGSFPTLEAWLRRQDAEPRE